jgi:hypothetical protein
MKKAVTKNKLSCKVETIRALASIVIAGVAGGNETDGCSTPKQCHKPE